MANEQKRPAPTFKPPLDNKRLGPQAESPPVGRRPLGRLPSEPRRLGPPVELPPSSPSRKPHPLADVNDRRQGSSDSTRRQGSMERMHSPMFSPQIMVESPTHSIGKLSLDAATTLANTLFSFLLCLSTSSQTFLSFRVCVVYSSKPIV